MGQSRVPPPPDNMTGIMRFSGTLSAGSIILLSLFFCTFGGVSPQRCAFIKVFLSKSPTPNACRDFLQESQRESAK
jgi:hypothetical protein